MRVPVAVGEYRIAESLSECCIGLLTPISPIAGE
jgi:hypothetical protein